MGIHMKKKRARMKTLSSSSSNRTDDKQLVKNRHFSKADTVKISGDQNESDDENTVKIHETSEFTGRVRKETENSEKHDFKTSDHNSKFSDFNAKDSDFSANIKNSSSEKFQKNG